MVYNFVPTDLKDKLIDEAKESPLLIHHYGMRVIMYNTNAFDEQPIDSWWDVTRPEWKGKVLMKDQIRSGAEFNMFASFVQYADEMAQSCLKEFGEEIVLHGTENAGYEFLKRLMDNGLILMADSSTVVRAVGSSKKKHRFRKRITPLRAASEGFLCKACSTGMERKASGKDRTRSSKF